MAPTPYNKQNHKAIIDQPYPSPPSSTRRHIQVVRTQKTFPLPPTHLPRTNPSKHLQTPPQPPPNNATPFAPSLGLGCFLTYHKCLTSTPPTPGIPLAGQACPQVPLHPSLQWGRPTSTLQPGQATFTPPTLTGTGPGAGPWAMGRDPGLTFQQKGQGKHINA